MGSHIARRDFLKAAPAAAGVLASVANLDPAPRDPRVETRPPAGVRISATPYRPAGDYPIQPTPYADVKIKDRFWKPKIDTNAVAANEPTEM